LERWKKLSKALYFKAIRYFSQFGLRHNVNKQMRELEETNAVSGAGTDQIEQILPGRRAGLDKA
jgi:ribosomal protein L35